MLDLPYGWISEREAGVLYDLSRACTGNILEVGSFVGRSTCAVAYGVRDSGRRNQFVSVDLHMKSLAELDTFYDGVFSPQNRPRVDGGYLLDLKRILREGGTEAALKRNLAERELAEYVTLLAGDFRDVLPRMVYDCVFLDVAHTVEEIDRNLPCLVPCIRPGTVLAFHDVESAVMKAAIAGLVHVEPVQQTERLYVCRCV